MIPETIYISGEHRQLLDQLCELIPDFDPEAPENLQRIFSLGLFALAMQVTSKCAEESKLELVVEVASAAREMIGNIDVDL